MVEECCESNINYILDFYTDAFLGSRISKSTCVFRKRYRIHNDHVKFIFPFPQENVRNGKYLTGPRSVEMSRSGRQMTLFCSDDCGSFVLRHYFRTGKTLILAFWHLS